MGIFSFGADKTVEAAGGLVEKTGSAFDKLFTSDEERAAGELLLGKMRQKPQEWAQELNVINAKSKNWFQAGWRPALGWVGALGLFFFFIPQYITGSIVWMAACWEALQVAGAVTPLPEYPVSSDGLWELVTLLLGGKVVRTAEKLTGREV